MSTQPEALRLADLIESDFDPDWMYETGLDQIAAELRRLHDEMDRERLSRQAAQAENEALKARLARAGLERQRAVLTKDALLRQALEALEEYQEKGAPFMSCDRVANAIRQHLEGNQ